MNPNIASNNQEFKLQLISPAKLITLIGSMVQATYNTTIEHSDIIQGEYLNNQFKDKKEGLYVQTSKIIPLTFEMNEGSLFERTIKLGQIDIEKGSISENAILANYELIKLQLTKKLKDQWGKPINPISIKIGIWDYTLKNDNYQLTRTDHKRIMGCFGWKNTDYQTQFPTEQFLAEGIFYKIKSVNGVTKNKL